MITLVGAICLTLTACGTSGSEQTATASPDVAESTLTPATIGATPAAPSTTSTDATGPPLTVSTDSTEPRSTDDSSIKIGVLNPTTGNFTVFGEQSNAGVQLYFEQVDSMVASRTIELVYADTAGDPQQALEQARRLVEEEEVDALLGLVNSAVVVALVDFADQSQVPLVVTVGSASSITLPENASDWVNRVSVASGQEERPLGWYAATELGYTTAATVTWDFLSGDERAAAFAETFGASGGEIVNEQKPPPNATEYGPFLSSLDPASTEAMYVFAAGPGSIAFFQQVQDFGLSEIVPMGSGFLTAGILEQMDDTALGLVQSAQYTPVIETQANKDFVAAYADATGQEAGVYGVQGYIGAQAMALAIEALGGDTSDGAALSDTIRSLEFESPSGPTSFDENGQVIRNMYITRVVESEGGVTQQIIDVIEAVDQFWSPPN